MIYRSLCSLILGPSGGGKSWLGATTPPPRLILDLEGRAKYTPAGRGAVFWDGMSDPREIKERSSTRTYIVPVPKMDVLERGVMPWLRSGNHPFTSVTLDSLMEAQMRSADVIAPGAAALRQQDFGSLLRQMQAFTRDLRDLTLDPATNVRCVVLIAGAKTDQGYQRPLMQGQINTQVSYFMDLVGYLEKIRNDEGGITRRLWIDQRPQNDLEVKDGTNDILEKFGGCIEMVQGDPAAPNFTTFYEALNVAQEGVPA